MRPEWIDVTHPLHSDMPVWPGDPPVVVERTSDVEAGDAFTLTRLALSAHSGTHVDAPRHYLKGGASIDAMPPEVGIGAVRVVEVREFGSIAPEQLTGERLRRGERVVFRTVAAPPSEARCDHFFSYAWLSVAAARWLAKRRVSLVGIDGPSVGPPTAEGDEVHRVLLGAGIWVIEGLDLSRVSAGRYRMVCLPLRIVGADGAPARVLLRRIVPPGSRHR